VCGFYPAFSLKDETRYKIACGTMKPKPPQSSLDDMKEIRRIDKSNMLQFSIETPKHYQKAEDIANRFFTDSQIVSYYGLNPADNVIIAGMGGSAIGGELLKDWARDKAQIPIEVSRDYSLPAYVNEKSLVLIVSYSGETEESLSAFLTAARRKCMIYCISSGGSLLEFAEKLGVPYLRVPAGMPPRAALPYLFAPLLMALEKTRTVSSGSEELSEAVKLLARISRENSPEKPLKDNLAKTLASGINGTVPVVYGFGVYRSVAQRFKQQFNENSKVPAKWEVFSELNHNEIVGWEKAGKLAKHFSAIFIRDSAEPVEIRSRIEITKTLMPKESKQFEVWAQGKSELAKMLSTVCIGDFTSNYLAILRKVDPTPVKTISLLKAELERNGAKQKIIRKLEKLCKSGKQNLQ
jgi:glucose/mannose-6-phosphate isomerase